MYSIQVEAYFSSAHNLRGYKGKCEALHGHNWKVQITVAKRKPDASGLVMDFRELKAKLHAVLDKLDHAYLNDIAYFKKHNPTSENIACYIYTMLKKDIAHLASVTVWESENSAATYSL
ncbi:MAG: 6-carboxytetrahydropterin synthase QueD [Candidatus Omnitrophica bacterium]|nr:6-carboxytetrahydropterin synthase QueD [Candidatus Omnitrophota bacterium]